MDKNIVAYLHNEISYSNEDKKTELHTSKMFVCTNILKSQKHAKLSYAFRSRTKFTHGAGDSIWKGVLVMSHFSV